MAGAIAATVALFSFVLATIPSKAEKDWAPRQWLFDDRLSRDLFIPAEDFVPEDEKTRREMLHTRALRGRDLRFAVLERADLRKVDLTARLERWCVEQVVCAPPHSDEPIGDLLQAGVVARFRGALPSEAKKRATRCPFKRAAGWAAGRNIR